MNKTASTNQNPKKIEKSYQIRTLIEHVLQFDSF